MYVTEAYNALTGDGTVQPQVDLGLGLYRPIGQLERRTPCHCERRNARTRDTFIFRPGNGSPIATNVVVYVAAGQHICFCFMAKSAFWRGFSALAPYTGVGPI